MSSWLYEYTGRGYLRFPELVVDIPSPIADLPVRIARGGPSRVEFTFEGEGEAPADVIDEVAKRLHGLLVVYCQAAIQDFDIGSIYTVDDDGTPHQHAYARVLPIPVPDAAVTVPFDHMTDMPGPDIEELRLVLRTGAAIKPAVLASIQHSLVSAEGDVEAFLANYAVLESVCGNKRAVDAFIRRVEPDVEVVKDSRRNDVTIYTRLRNAKGHPTGMPPAEASARIHHLLPRLRSHVRTALIESSTSEHVRQSN